MLINLAALLVGLAILVTSADRFVLGTASIARNLGISPLIIGLTIVGFGTSAPEILVSGFAAWNGNPGLAVGNALGSNIANIGLILGATALLSPITLHSGMLHRELPVLLFISITCYGLSLVGGLDRIDGLIMLTGLILFILWLVRSALKNRHDDPLHAEIEQEIPISMALGWALFWFVVGLIGLLLSSRLLVWAAVEIAIAFSVSDLVIGLTIVALGTSLPELAASIASVLKKEDDLALGNIIGSNVYNLLAVFSLPGLIQPGPLDTSVLARDFPWMLGFTGALFLLGFDFGKHGKISRAAGGLLLLAYGGYQTLVIRAAL